MNTTETIIHHAALAFFACAYADHCEEIGDPLRGEIMNQLPELPDCATQVAAELVRVLVAENPMFPDLDSLFAYAVDAHNGDRAPTAENFGHYLAMQAMGHGVGLGDAFGDAVYETLVVPHFDGVYLEL